MNIERDYINLDLPIPFGVIEIAHLYLNHYSHPLPNSIEIIRDIWIRNYNHALPASITTISRFEAWDYTFPLPDNLVLGGNSKWKTDGKYHNTSGPAIILGNSKFYYLRGVLFSENEWNFWKEFYI